jgi:hypothetical protein
MSWVKKFDTVKATANAVDVTSDDVDSTGCDILIAHVADYAFQPSGTFSDNKGNTWTALTVRTDGQYGRSKWYYSTGANLTSVGAGHHFIYTSNAGGNADYPIIEISGWSGADTSPFDVQNFGAGLSVASQASGSISPTSGDLVLTSITENNSSVGSAGGTPTTPSGFTLLSSVNYVPSNNFGNHVAYVAGSSGSYNATWTYAQTSDGVVEIISFKGAGGGGTTDGTLASTPTGTCAFVGASTASSVLASIPTGTGAFVGASVAASPFTDAPTGTCSFTGIEYHNWTSVPNGVCAFVGAAKFEGVLACTPTGTVLWQAGLTNGILAAAPTATCAFNAIATFNGSLVSNPSATCAFSAIGLEMGVLASTPHATCSFVGTKIADLNSYLRRYLNDKGA